jgi:phosphatidylglycerophosphate synthase
MSYLGSVLDPIADKILVGVLTVSLSIAHLIPGKCNAHRNLFKTTFSLTRRIGWYIRQSMAHLDAFKDVLQVNPWTNAQDS